MTAADPRDATLVLVRHGRTAWVEEGRFQGVSDVPLSAHGRAQAAAVGACLGDAARSDRLPIPGGAPRSIRHSPLARAADTAAAIAQARHATAALVADEDLREIGQGAWEGLRHEDVMARWPDELASWRQDPLHHHAPGGESLGEASVRADRAVARMLDDVGSALLEGRRGETADARREAAPTLGDAVPPGPGAAPIVASHDPWAIVVAHDGILRLALLRLLGLPLDRYWSFPFALCAVTVVELRAGRARLRAHNLEEHLVGIATSGAPTGEAGSRP
ncbi:MAG: histidine phosphatase family protein [Chloroflexota bacterium]